LIFLDVWDAGRKRMELQEEAFLFLSGIKGKSHYDKVD